MKKKLQAPGGVAAQFSDWCSPRRGISNPENQTNDVWSWLIQSRAWPHAAHEAVGIKKEQAPTWCFSRFGQSETRLSDGTIIYIGGEHEDSYDPDFYIYNDVVVVRPDGSVEIYGYPVDVFAPLDFHSATMFGDDIFIIGGQSLLKYRNPTNTPVYRLRLSDFSIHPVAVHGQAPCWLFEHEARLEDDRPVVICTGGQIAHQPTGRVVENLTTWAFDLDVKSWTSISTLSCKRWLLMREDESPNDLREIEEVAKPCRIPVLRKFAEKYRAKFAQRGHVVDPGLFFSRFSPPIPHCVLESDEYKVYRILIDGVVVRYVEDMFEIAVTVEGDLSPEKLVVLRQHGLDTYSRLEGVPYKCVML